MWKRTETTDSWGSAGSSFSCMRRLTFDRSGLLLDKTQKWCWLLSVSHTTTIHKDLQGTWSNLQRICVFLCACEIIRKGFQVAEKNAAVIVGDHSKTMVHCAGCERPILDRFLLNVLDRAWHIKCVQCCECKCNLTEKCFSREGKLYCKNDFFR